MGLTFTPKNISKQLNTTYSSPKSKKEKSKKFQLNESLTKKPKLPENPKNLGRLIGYY